MVRMQPRIVIARQPARAMRPRKTSSKRNGIFDERLVRLQRGLRQLQIRFRLPASPVHGGLVFARPLNQAREFVIRNALHVQLPSLLDQVHRRRDRLAPATRTADAHDPRADRVAQPAQGPQTPQHFLHAVDDHVLVVDPRHGQGVGVLVQVPGHDPFVPVVQRPRLMADQKDRVLAQLVDWVHRAHQIAGPVARGVNEQHIGRRHVVDGREFAGRPQLCDWQEAEWEVGRFGKPVQFRPDPLDLLLNVGRRFDPAPVPPTGLRSALSERIGQNRLDDQWPSWRSKGTLDGVGSEHFRSPPGGVCLGLGSHGWSNPDRSRVTRTCQGRPSPPPSLALWVWMLPASAS